MFSLLLVSVCYLFGGALGLFLSGYTTKYLSPKEIEDEMKEELLMIAQMDRLCFESLYDDEVSNMPSVALDDDTKRQLKDRVLDYEVPGNIIKMYYDYEKEGFCYYTKRGEVGYKYLNVVCRKYVLDHNAKELYREGVELIERAPPPEMDACFTRKKIKPFKQENKRVNKFIHLGTFEDKKTSLVPTHSISFMDYVSNKPSTQYFS
jgi:hypothetical protein